MTAALAANPTQRYRWVILLIATFAQACACFFVRASARSPCSSERPATLVATDRPAGVGGAAGADRRPAGGRRAARPLLRAAGGRPRHADRRAGPLRLAVGHRLPDHPAVPGGRRRRLQHGAAGRQQVGVTLVRQDPAGLRHGHPPGRAAAGRRAVRRAAAIPGGDLRLAQRIPRRRPGSVPRRAGLHALLPHPAGRPRARREPPNATWARW